MPGIVCGPGGRYKHHAMNASQVDYLDMFASTSSRSYASVVRVFPGRDEITSPRGRGAAVSKGGISRLLPILRDARLWRAPQDEVVGCCSDRNHLTLRRPRSGRLEG